MDEKILKLKKLVMNSKRLVAFTGAGFSAESGISTYRGTGGLWSKYDPSVYADINYFLRDSTYYWNFSHKPRSSCPHSFTDRELKLIIFLNRKMQEIIKYTYFHFFFKYIIVITQITLIKSNRG